MRGIEARASQLLAAVEALLASPILPFTADLRKRLPCQGGLYYITQESDDGLRAHYVGKTNHLQRRVYDLHFKGSSAVSTLRKTLLASGSHADEAEVTVFLSGCGIQFLTVDDERERLWLEHFAISVLQPIYNR
jgi:excinuclease UvrABC nuclease subunit